MGMLSAVKHEARHIGGVTLYLLFCFGVASTLNKLFLAVHQIEFSALLPTVIGALALAKVVVVLDKTLFYCAVAAPVLFAERVWHFYRETGVLGEGVREAWTHMDPHPVSAKVIIVGLVFAGYHLYQGIDRRLGQGKLRRVIFSRG